jgi:MFS family permease
MAHPWRGWICILLRHSRVLHCKLSCQNLSYPPAERIKPQASFAEEGVQEEFHTAHTVSVLAVSLYVMGLGFGPLLFAPFSEMWGRTPVYRIAFFLFTVFGFAVAFAGDMRTFDPQLAIHRNGLTPLFQPPSSSSASLLACAVPLS